MTSTRTHVLAWVLAVAACSGAKTDAPRPTDPTSAAAADAPSGGSAMTQPDPTATTSQALAPTAALLAWLDHNGGARDIGGPPRLKLPVVVTMDADRLGIVGATLGEIAVTLDDTALGIALADRVRQKCPAGSTTCTVWLEGTWRGHDDAGGQIKVTKFAGLVAAGDAGDRVEILP